jgi:hypothetical protein
VLHLHPAIERRSLKDWIRKEVKRKVKFLKKNFKKSLPDKKRVTTFAPANRKTSKQKK